MFSQRYLHDVELFQRPQWHLGEGGIHILRGGGGGGTSSSQSIMYQISSSKNFRVRVKISPRYIIVWLHQLHIHIFVFCPTNLVRDLLVFKICEHECEIFLLPPSISTSVRRQDSFVSFHVSSRMHLQVVRSYHVLTRCINTAQLR